jgi:hypothetical protein
MQLYVYTQGRGVLMAGGEGRRTSRIYSHTFCTTAAAVSVLPCTTRVVFGFICATSAAPDLSNVAR